jgi:hypothetical protein
MRTIQTLKQINPLHTFTNRFHFILSSGLGLKKRAVSFRFPHQNPMFISLLSHPNFPDLITIIVLDDTCRLITGIADSNPVEGMDVRVLIVVCCVGSSLCDEPITRSDQFY